MIWVPFWWRWRQPKLRFGCCWQPSHLYVHFASQNMDYAVSITEKKQTQIEKRFRSVMVEMAVIETASENQFPRISTSVVCLLRFPSESAGKQAHSYGIL